MGVLATVAVVAVAFAAGSDRFPLLSAPLPVIAEPTPVPEMTETELDQLARVARELPEPFIPKVRGGPLWMPDGAWAEGFLKVDSYVVPPPGVTLLRPPLYNIYLKGEVASVSAVDGSFHIGEDHRDTFQFLIEQLGEGNMQLLPRDFYEERWGPWRDQYQ